MPVQVNVPEQKLEPLNAKARAELSAVVTQYAIDVIQEAERLEASVRASGKNDPEITSSLVSDANLLIRRGYRKPPKKGTHIFLQVISSIAALATGLLADRELLKDATMLTLFIFVLTGAILTSVIVAMRE